MAILTNWNLYYNLEDGEKVRANLVYTPYVSPDGNIFCMSFNRDLRYHNSVEENSAWDDVLLDERYAREIKFRMLVEGHLPTLKVLKTNSVNRTIQLEWHGDDFYMQAIKAGSYEAVLPDWKKQWKDRMLTMWKLGIRKMSLHPNSWTVVDGTLVPFNWFFCYNDTDMLSIKQVIMQISQGRQQKLIEFLKNRDMNIETPYSVNVLQEITLHSFRSNYPQDLIDTALEELKCL